MDPARIEVWADPGCPWAHLAVYRLHEARARNGLQDRVVFDVRMFPLELFNEQPTPRLVLDAEIPVVGGLDPQAGFSLWSVDAASYPVTMLPAMEAVIAAKAQGLQASEALDRALRVAFFRDSRCISMLHEIEGIAEETAQVEAAPIVEALRSGSCRAQIFADMTEAKARDVQGSPHVFLPDGTGHHNPGIEMHKIDDLGSGGYPVVDKDHPEIYDELVTAAGV